MRVALFSMVLTVATFLAACGDGGGADSPDATTAGTATIGPGTTASGPPPPPVSTTSPPPLLGLDLETVLRGSDEVVFVTSPPEDPRLFIVERDGRIRIIVDGELVEEPFLDITSEVGAGGLEQGLLGLAFHPRYGENGRFFVYFTNDDGDSRVVEYRVSADQGRADRESARRLIAVGQPASNHNAGMLLFGPDGYLYIGFGDGGGANDQFGNGQRPDTLLGTILRIDVDAAVPYAIPPDNPFVSGGVGALEVWAYGLRNPWRFTIDEPEGLLYVADVGQNRWEEISVVPADGAGLNYGWPIKEGDDCFVEDPCSGEGLVPPALVYGHEEGCSVIGGFVYRGASIPELAGHYFFGDYCGKWIRSFRYLDRRATDVRDWTADFGEVGQVLSFGRDAQGEIYVTTQEGFVYRIVPRR